MPQVIDGTGSQTPVINGTGSYVPIIHGIGHSDATWYYPDGTPVPPQQPASPQGD